MKKFKGCKSLWFGLVLSLVLIVFGCSSSDSYTPNFGVVVFEGGWIGILDGATNEVTTPLLTGELEISHTDILDVAISPDRKTTLVSNFNDNTVYFINTSVPLAPVVSGSVTLSFHAEDIAITPDGRYALVTDGGSTGYIGVLDVENISLVEEFDTTSYGAYNQAVATDGETVLTIDYLRGLMTALTLDDDGHLTYVSTTDISNGSTLYPTNVTISPDGQTAILANESYGVASNMAFTILAITGPGQVSVTDYLTPAIDLLMAQSVVFNRTGTRAYAYCIQDYDTDPLNNVIVELKVTGPGSVSDSGTYVEVDFQATFGWFGVDALAVDNNDNCLYVSNMIESDSKSHIQVIDLTTLSVINTLDFDPVAIGDPAVDTDSIPAGICIWNP